jgi:hypothetical protein
MQSGEYLPVGSKTQIFREIEENLQTQSLNKIWQVVQDRYKMFILCS